MPNNELEIGASYEVLQRYVCKNRVTNAKIQMLRIKYLVNGKDVGRGTRLTCLDHNETRHCKNKTEALYQIRQPWVWCDECSQIHFNTEWQNQLHHGVETKPMTDKNANTEIRKEFCPNCEAETPCTHEAELFVCDISGEDFAKYIVSRKANVSDVSMTQDVLIDIKTPQSVENNNPDYYKDELYLDEDFRMLAKTYPADVSAIGVTTLIDYVEALEADLARLTAIIARLKEDGERLASNVTTVIDEDGHLWCNACKNYDIHTEYCPITLHRALMKELE